MGYHDTPLRARLNEEGYRKLQERQEGKERHRYFVIGKAAVHLDSGLAYAAIPWGTNGLDVPLSPDIQADIIDAYELSPQVFKPEVSEGKYELRNRSGHILATALVVNHPGGSKVTVIGKNRVDVIKLYEQIRAGETIPEAIGGRKGLIQSLRSELRTARNQLHQSRNRWSTLEDQLMVSDEALEEAKQEKRDLEDELDRLEQKLNRRKHGWLSGIFGRKTANSAA